METRNIPTRNRNTPNIVPYDDIADDFADAVDDFADAAELKWLLLLFWLLLNAFLKLFIPEFLLFL